ncbi:MAG: class I SAM-dependent methyltransferase [Chloroflexota bacterium]
MRTFLSLENKHQEPLPPDLQGDDVRYAPALVRHFLQEYTRPGERVIDPFAGLGTTLVVAEGMGRLPYGIEIDERKAAYCRSRLAHPENLVHGDARRLLSYDLPICDFSMTSPPFSTLEEASDPLSDYRVDGRGYKAYLRELRQIYAQLAQRMRPAGTVVIEAANLKQHGRLTTLAWDIAGEVGQVLHFDGEVVIGWDHYGYGYQHSYCLVFSVI